jgi:hypothetical protein
MHGQQNEIIQAVYGFNVDRDGSVGIATRYVLDGPLNEFRCRRDIPRPGAHQASFTVGTWSFPGVKRPGRGVGHPPHLAPRLKKE